MLYYNLELKTIYILKKWLFSELAWNISKQSDGKSSVFYQENILTSDKHVGYGEFHKRGDLS